MRAPGFTIMVHRDGAVESRQWHLPMWGARLLSGVAIALVVLAIIAVALYGPTVRAAASVPLLNRRIERLDAENRRVTELAIRLDEAEARYAQLRGMLGADIALPDLPTPEVGVRPANDDRLWVAPPMMARAPLPPGDTTTAGDPGPSIPTRWPLTVSSFRTRGLALGDPNMETHMGLDLAVPVGSDVRASGGGRVRDTGIDPSYGLFVLLEHPDGYETMYGHLSRVLVTRGASVRAGQVIALSGNTGRSSAPHLHFEVRRGGRSVDPLTIVREGN